MERLEIDINKPTPRLDKISSDFYKILSATAAKFIPDACKALIEDWKVSSEALKNPANKKLRDAMREKILDRFSKDREPRAIWNDEGVKKYFPDEFRNPIAQEGTKYSAIENLKAAHKAVRKYQQKIVEKSTIFDKLVKDLPEPPKEEEPEEITGGWSMGPSKYQKLGEETKSPLTKMGDIRDGSRIFWNALTGEEKDNKYMPHMGEGPIVDLIRKTREYRKFVYELDDNEREGLHEWITFAVEAGNDMLKILEEAMKK